MFRNINSGSGEILLHDLKNWGINLAAEVNAPHKVVQEFSEKANRFFKEAAAICSQCEEEGDLLPGTSDDLSRLLAMPKRLTDVLLSSSPDEKRSKELGQLKDFLCTQYSKRGLLYDIVADQKVDLHFDVQQCPLAGVERALMKVITTLLSGALLENGRILWKNAGYDGKELCVIIDTPKRLYRSGIVVRPRNMIPTHIKLWGLTIKEPSGRKQ
ncbi:hypothetical protein ACFL03_08810 [Thermodesulfobacteriota bacterium]